MSTSLGSEAGKNGATGMSAVEPLTVPCTNPIFHHCTVCSRYKAVFGVHNIELRYKRGTLWSMCCNVCHQGEQAINDHVASRMQ